VRDEQVRRHEVWYNPINGRRTRVPRHPGQEIPTGTLHRMLHDLGLTRDDLARAG
jgi:predicted RNA binding protein YcfA (HicA-like mRNA interferase family)